MPIDSSEAESKGEIKDGLAQIMAGIIELSRENLIREVIEAKNDVAAQADVLDESNTNPGQSFAEDKTTSPIPAIIQLEILQGFSDFWW